MKLSRIASLLAGAGILAGAQAALASDGTITFNGKLISNTCDISVNGSGASNATVALPPVSADTLAAAGATAGWTQFDIELSNCSGSATSALAYFETGPNVDSVTGQLNNTAASGAQNVQIGLRELNNNSIRIGTGAAAQSAPFAVSGSGPTTLTYQAGYVATGTATAGPVESSVTYSIVYQ